MENLQHRVTAVEQILPTLATRADLAAAVLATKADLAAAVLATKADLAAAIAPLATKAEMVEEGERTRHYVKVITESLRTEIRAFADGVSANQQRIDAARVEFRQADEQLDRRVTKLEAARQKRR